MSQDLQRPGQTQFLRGMPARLITQEHLDAIWYWFDERGHRITQLETELAEARTQAPPP